MQKLSPAN